MRIYSKTWPVADFIANLDAEQLAEIEVVDRGIYQLRIQKTVWNRDIIAMKYIFIKGMYWVCALILVIFCA